MVVSVNRAPEYRFSKPPVEAITLIEGLGVDGDGHAGVTVRHRSQMAADPTRPNLLKRVVVRDEAGRVVRRAGIMSVVRAGGRVSPGDVIRAVLPEAPHEPLAPV